MVSSHPQKTRKAWFNMPLHLRRRSMTAPLSRELMEKLLEREIAVTNIPVRKGDTVKVVRGSFRGHIGKVAKVDTVSRRISIDKATIAKADGKQKPRWFSPSKVVITKLDLTDQWRRERLKIGEEEGLGIGEEKPEAGGKDEEEEDEKAGEEEEDEEDEKKGGKK